MKSFFRLAAIALFSLPALAQNQAANQTRIRGVIKPGDFVGSAVDKSPDGRLHAEELHVFPESMRALAKVIAPWERTPVAPPLPEPLRTIPKREP